MKKIFTEEPQSQKDRRVFGCFCFWLRRRKAKRQNLSGNKMLVLAPYNQRSDAFCHFRSESCLVRLHCRHLIGNGNIIILCGLCVLSEAPQGLDNRAGGYKIDIRTKQKQGWDPQFSWRFIGLINREEFWLNAGGL